MAARRGLKRGGVKRQCDLKKLERGNLRGEKGAYLSGESGRGKDPTSNI